MVKTDDSVVKQLHIERKQLINTFSNKLISEADFETKMSEIGKKLKDRTQILINTLVLKNSNVVQDITNKTNLEEEKMADKTAVAKESKVAKTPKVKKVTRAELIIEALQLKSIKNMDDVVKRVKQQRPEENEKKIKAMTSAIINLVVTKKKAKYAAMSWDMENYLLTVPKVE